MVVGSRGAWLPGVGVAWRREEWRDESLVYMHVGGGGRSAATETRDRARTTRDDMVTQAECRLVALWSRQCSTPPGRVECQARLATSSSLPALPNGSHAAQRAPSVDERSTAHRLHQSGRGSRLASPTPPLPVCGSSSLQSARHVRDHTLQTTSRTPARSIGWLHAYMARHGHPHPAAMCVRATRPD